MGSLDLYKERRSLFDKVGDLGFEVEIVDIVPHDFNEGEVLAGGGFIDHGSDVVVVQQMWEWAFCVDHDFPLDVSALGGKEWCGSLLLLLLFGPSIRLVFGGVGIVGEGLLAVGGGVGLAVPLTLLLALGASGGDAVSCLGAGGEGRDLTVEDGGCGIHGGK